MADNVTITPGVGTNIAADDIASVYYQRVKMTTGQDGTAVGDVGGRVVDTTTALSIAATATAAYVDPWTPRRFFTQTPTISTTPAYTSGDCLGGLQTISNAARASGAGGAINSIRILDKTQAQRAAMDLLFFSSSVSSAGDNNPAAFSDADMANCVAIVSILAGDYNTAWAGVPLNSVAFKPNTATATWPATMAIPYFCAAGTSLYVQAVVRGTPTYTSTTDVVFQYCLTLD
jgi:hypothetical protein